MPHPTTLLSVLCAVGLGLVPRAAEACGGFFCSQRPVVQTGERIVFEVDEDRVTAYVQIQYAGDDPNFAWIIPVPEAPVVEVGVGQAMFDALEAQTAPIFVSPRGTEASPAVAQLGPAGCGGSDGFGVGGLDEGEPRLRLSIERAPAVEVYQKERVGPFEAATLDAREARDLNRWLQVNGYRVDPRSEPIVQSYLDAGMKLFALRLAQDVPSTALEPVKLSYREARGCAGIPMRLTAVAAVPGLEVVTWVFGRGRATPLNFEEIELEHHLLRSPEQYRGLLETSLDTEADGHGWVVEYARPTTELADQGDPTLRGLLERRRFVTRLRTYLDPDEMTVDPELTVTTDQTETSNLITLGAPDGGAAPSTLGLGLLALIVLRRRSAR